MSRPRGSSGQPPSCEDPSWKKRAAPLIPFLKEPRGWDELAIWADANQIPDMLLRNILAWLSVNRMVECAPILHQGRTQWTWMLTAMIVEEAPGEVDASMCPHCGGFIQQNTCLLCGRTPTV